MRDKIAAVVMAVIAAVTYSALTPGTASAVGGEIAINPTSGPVGTVITVNGSGWGRPLSVSELGVCVWFGTVGVSDLNSASTCEGKGGVMITPNNQATFTK